MPQRGTRHWIIRLGMLAALVAFFGAEEIRSADAARPEAAPFRLLQAIVRVRATVPPLAQTAALLGTERIGTGVVIDSDGLILTLGPLIVESGRVEVEATDGAYHPAEFVAYDDATGLGLVRARGDFHAPPVRLGRSGELRVGERLLTITHGGAAGVKGTTLVGRRPFAGDWEFLLE
ncbi:MAG TPA: S1C family serine protease, partial [Azospirillaceae bacterium]|nr:S1C family serine protease [Azospirillaceae bacterium]